MSKPAHLPAATSRERMLEATIDLLRGSGLTGAGINQVIAASGAPKGSMYHHFPGGKLELAREALELLGQRIATRLRDEMAGGAPAADKIRAIFQNSAKAAMRAGYQRSCGIGAVTLDLDEQAAPLAPVCAQIFASWHAAVASGLMDIPSAQRDALARFVVTNLQGAQIQSRAERNTRTLIEAGELTAALVKLATTEQRHVKPARAAKPRKA